MRGSSAHISLRQHRNNAPNLLLPEFQRGIVWTAEQVMSLIDSAERGYPLGQLLVWEVYEGSIRRQYVLDGQQRLTALTGRKVGETQATWDVWFDMDAKGWVLGKPKRGFPLWPMDNPMDDLHVMEEAGIFTDPYGKQACQRRDDLNYCTNFPAFVVEGGTTQDVLEMFLRINTGGTPLDPKLVQWLKEKK